MQVLRLLGKLLEELFMEHGDRFLTVSILGDILIDIVPDIACIYKV